MHKQEKLPLLIDKISDVIWSYNFKRQCYNYISPSVLKLRGFTAEEAMLEGMHDSLEQEDYLYIVNHLGPRIKRFEEGDSSFETLTTEVRQICKDGSKKWVEMVTTLVKNEQGKVDEIVGVSRDISQRKKEEELLLDTRNFLDTTFNFTGTGIALVHENGTLLNINKGFGKMLGYPKSYIIGKSLYDFIVDGDESCVREVFEMAYNERELEKQTEIRLKNLQNQVVWGLITISGVKSMKDRCTHWVMQIQDTTDRKKSDEIIRLLNTNLQLKNNEMEQLVYVTSHDLRSPLVNIQGFSKELELSFKEAKKLFRGIADEQPHQDQLTVIEKDIFEAFEYINISIRKMDRLLSGLLQYSRLGKQMSQVRLINMNELIADVFKNFEYIIKTKELTIEIAQLESCRAREDLINQAFSNLLGNALKYLDPKRKGQIKITSATEDDYIVYCLEDNGIGIEKQDQKRIFELFCRLNPQMGEGEGLGLSEVKKILDINHGKIHLESEPGQGSRFFVFLPKKEKAEKTF